MSPTRPGRTGSAHPLTGHTGAVNSVAFAPDGHTLATGSGDKTVILWDVRDPTRPHRLGHPLTGHTGAVNAVAFAPDGHTLATASADKTVILWDVPDPTRPQRLGAPADRPHRLGERGGVRPGRAHPGHRQRRRHGDLVGCAGPDPAAAASAHPLTGHTGPVYSVAFAPDGHTLATASSDQTVILWDVADPTRPQRLGHPLTGHTGPCDLGGVRPGRAHPGHRQQRQDGDLVGCARPDPAAAASGDPLTGHTGAVNSVAFAPDGHTLATGSDDKTVILWDVRDPTRPHRLGAPADRPHRLGVLGGVRPGRAHPGHRQRRPDGDPVGCAGPDPAAAASGQPLTGHTGYVYSVAFAPDGHTLATGSGDKTVILWDVRDPTRPQRLGQPLDRPHRRP